jgi:acyl-CoA thioester hydrolase
MDTAPSPPEHVLAIEPSAADIDELGHVSNVTYVRWIQDVAKAHSAACGWDADAYVRFGAVFVVRRHEIDYLVPALQGDRIELRTHVARFGAATSERHTRIVRLRDGVELARAVTLWAFVSLRTQRPSRIPPEIRGAFRSDEPA